MNRPLSLGEVGGPGAPGQGPSIPWSVFTYPAPCSLQPCPLPGVAQRGLPGYQVGTGGLEQPGGDMAGGSQMAFFS